jgi:hypothetical protein
VFSDTGVAVMGSVEVSTLNPRGPGDPELPQAHEGVPYSSEDSSRVVPRRLVVNSRLPKWMVLPGARPTPVGSLPLETKESFSEGTIGTSRGKARYKSPFWACQLSVFFAPTRYRVVKIARSCSEVVLRTTKNTMVYSSSGPSLEVIALRLAF